MSEALEARALQGAAGLETALSQLDALLAQGTSDPLCNGAAWVGAYAGCWTRPEEFYGWSLHDGEDAPVGLALLRPEANGGGLLRRASLLQDGSFDSDYLSLPARPGYEERVLESLLGALRKRGGVEALLLSCLPEDSPTLLSARSLAERRSLELREVPVACLSAELAPDQDALLRSLASRMRSKVRRALRQAEESELSVRWCSTQADVRRDLESLFRLHQARWVASGEPGSLADERRQSFYVELAQGALERDALRLSALERDGEVVAVQFGLLAGERYYQLQEGFDPDWGERRVGIALRAHSMVALGEQGVRHYDFMAGDARHKRDWGAQPRPCVSCAIGVGSLRSRALYAAQRALSRGR